MEERSVAKLFLHLEMGGANEFQAQMKSRLVVMAKG